MCTGDSSLAVRMLEYDADHPSRAGGYEILELYLHKKARAYSGAVMLFMALVMTCKLRCR
jgi:hypothetical protein